jgi:hypothetical protein
VENVRCYRITFASFDTPKTTFLNKFLSSVIFLMLLGLGNLAWTQHPIGYGSLHALSQTGTFSFEGLDRKIVKEKSASFFVEKTVDITFELLVTPNGNVKYVRSPRVGSEFYELRLACTSALYDFVFSPVSAESGEKWLKAKLIFEDR